MDEQQYQRSEEYGDSDKKYDGNWLGDCLVSQILGQILQCHTTIMNKVYEKDLQQAG
jgi:hypothetical protein